MIHCAMLKKPAPEQTALEMVTLDSLVPKDHRNQASPDIWKLLGIKIVERSSLKYSYKIKPRQK